MLERAFELPTLTDRPIPGLFAGGELVGELFYLSYPIRHPPDVGRGVRKDGRRLGGRLREVVTVLDRCPVLKEMFDTQSTYNQKGERVPIHSNIDLPYAEALYETVLRAAPAIALEVGMAFGVSSLAILCALRDGGRDGRLITIDPYQSRPSAFDGCGVAAVARAGLAGRHEVLEEFDYHALPRLQASGLKVDFAYVDGWHTFDYALLDWWYVDKMLVPNGLVAFNDCGWPAVEKVIRFVLTHRRYAEVDVGLAPQYAGQSRRQELLRRLALRSKRSWYRRSEDRYVRKLEAWEPRWDFFAPF